MLSLDLEDNTLTVSHLVQVDVGYIVWSMDAKDLSKAPIAEELHSSHKLFDDSPSKGCKIAIIEYTLYLPVYLT